MNPLEELVNFGYSPRDLDIQKIRLVAKSRRANAHATLDMGDVIGRIVIPKYRRRLAGDDPATFSEISWDIPEQADISGQWIMTPWQFLNFKD